TAVQRVGHGRFVLSCGGRLGGAASCRDDAPRRGTPRYHPACRCSLARASTASLGCDGPTRPVLLRRPCGLLFFRRLTGDGRVDACARQCTQCAAGGPTQGLTLTRRQCLALLGSEVRGTAGRGTWSC